MIMKAWTFTLTVLRTAQQKNSTNAVEEHFKLRMVFLQLTEMELLDYRIIFGTMRLMNLT